MDDAVDAIDSVCPGFADEFQNIQPPITLRELTPGPEGGEVEAGGAHDHDTIAINFGAISSPAGVGSVIYHEYQHVKRARENNAEKDPTDGSAPSGNTLAEYTASQLEGANNHVDIYADQLTKLCAVVQIEPPSPGSELDAAECEAIQDGATEFKDEAQANIDAVRDAAEKLMDTDPVSAGELNDLADDAELELESLCEPIANAWPCPD